MVEPNKLPAWNTSYPVTPVSSVAPDHERFVLVAVVPEAERTGAVGAVVSVVPDPALTVIFALLTSKKIWLEPFTMILPVEVDIFGMVTACEPSLGVPDRRVVHVVPLSVDHKISTLDALTPLDVVPATFQVMIWLVPPLYVVAEFCEVILKGPAVPLTVTTISSELLPEPPDLLSRTVNRKFKVRATVGTASTVISDPAVVVDPANTEAIRGKYRTGEAVGVHDLNVGPEVLVPLAAELAPVWSWRHCPFVPIHTSGHLRWHRFPFRPA